MYRDEKNKKQQRCNPPNCDIAFVKSHCGLIAKNFVSLLCCHIDNVMDKLYEGAEVVFYVDNCADLIICFVC